jgi:PBSX family phage terminase large subunit
VRYAAHEKQQNFHLSPARIRGAFAGKRGGKTEAGAIESILCTSEQRGYKHSDVDPYIGVVIAPTSDMLRRLSLQKLLAYAKPFVTNYHQTHQEIDWDNGARIYGISADKPQRLEGIKANWIWMDEVFQMPEQIFLEAMARVSDTEGFIWCTGSLGTQYTNPKSHWVYKHFKERPLDGSECFEWSTADNPYYPRAELERLKDTLDPRTYRQMFEIDWSVPGTALVYDQFDEANIQDGYTYNPLLPTYVSIDWGWAHPAAALFFQYDRANDRVYLFDEIVKSKLKIDKLYDLIMQKPYKITEWICDIAGNQEREQTGISNVQWFKEKGITFKFRTSAINYGVSIVRSYIRNTKGVARFYIDSKKCPKTLDNLYNYSYEEKKGVIVSENPVKENDDAVDALRYYFVNKHDSLLKENAVQMIKR